ncbi:MAG: mechanosensitive ion channel family protein [Dehalococcoidia bacterium]
MTWFMESGIWIIVAVVVATLVWWACRKWAPRWIALLVKKITPTKEDWSRGARVTGHILVYIWTIIIAAALVLAILPRVGIDVAIATNALKDAGIAVLEWLRDSGIKVAIILVVAFIIQQISKSLIPRFVSRHVTRQKKQRLKEEAEQRAETLIHFLTSTITVVIWAIAIFTILSEFNINIAPLMAGAGILGIAIGFGAQNLIRDLLGGIFIIIEDQYSVGDWVEIAGKSGGVEYLGLRRTILRDLNGTRHVVPNGEIKTASNLSQDWGCVNLNIRVAYGEDLDQVADILNRVGKEIKEEEPWRDIIMETPTVLRVDNFDDSGIELKIWGKTKPLLQWRVMGEMRRRIKRTFDQEGIAMPWPYIKLYLGDRVALNTLSKYGEETSSRPEQGQNEKGGMGGSSSKQ